MSNPDPSLAGVTFEPPTKITETDLRLSGKRSDSSRQHNVILSVRIIFVEDDLRVTELYVYCLMVQGKYVTFGKT